MTLTFLKSETAMIENSGNARIHAEQGNDKNVSEAAVNREFEIEVLWQPC